MPLAISWLLVRRLGFSTGHSRTLGARGAKLQHALRNTSMGVFGVLVTLYYIPTLCRAL